MDEHEGVVSAPIAAGGIGVHYIHLPPQIVPVLLPAVISFQPAGMTTDSQAFAEGVLEKFACALVSFLSMSSCRFLLFFTYS